jgi:anti-sigma regulatory factor (Ser/Thr protein kinase)
VTTWLYERDSSLSELRHQVCRWAEQRHLDRPDDLALVVSELVTNAVVHAHAQTVPVHLELEGVGAMVSVDDPSALTPVPTPAEPWGEHGRGLLVVEMLSDRWGCTPIPGGKRVWCEIR